MPALIFRSPFDEAQLDSISSLIKRTKPGRVQKRLDRTVRDTAIQFISRRKHPELFTTLDDFIWKANLMFGVEYDYAGARFYQLGHYGEGQFYNWHMDASFKNKRKERKLSFTLQLSDPDTYKGGDLEFKEKELDRDAVRKKGNIIVFESILTHRVTPVTEGFRRSLVGWYTGKPWSIPKEETP